ncbi:MAG: FadR family transcriptional regulator [Deltaproteobacteria bacterium]|nr:FadR family transcriptional regulator [Deltaproteobacteria bacterium]
MAGGSERSAERLREELRQRIMTDALPAGMALEGERVLAPALATNRNTLREAIRMLEQDRLVTVRHGKAVVVNDFRADGRIDLFGPFIEHGRDLAERVRALEDGLALRRGLLEVVVTLAAARAEPADQERLDTICAGQLAAFVRGDREALAIGDRAWLDALVDAAHSLPVRWMANELLEAFGRLAGRIPAIWLVEPSYPEFLRALLSAIAEHDVPRARAVALHYFDSNDAKVRPLLPAVVAALSARMP